jgi:hypothetical protein
MVRRRPRHPRARRRRSGLVPARPVRGRADLCRRRGQPAGGRGPAPPAAASAHHAARRRQRQRPAPRGPGRCLPLAPVPAPAQRIPLRHGLRSGTEQRLGRRHVPAGNGGLLRARAATAAGAPAGLRAGAARDRVVGGPRGVGGAGLGGRHGTGQGDGGRHAPAARRGASDAEQSPARGAAVGRGGGRPAAADDRRERRPARDRPTPAGPGRLRRLRRGERGRRADPLARQHGQSRHPARSHAQPGRGGSAGRADRGPRLPAAGQLAAAAALGPGPGVLHPGCPPGAGAAGSCQPRPGRLARAQRSRRQPASGNLSR